MIADQLTIHGSADVRVKLEEWSGTAYISRVCAGGARLAGHEAKSMKSNHEVDAPTSMDLSASRPAWSKPSVVALSFDTAP